MSEQAGAAMESAECKHCHRRIVNDPTDGWVDPEAPTDPDEDDHIWRETCDRHDTFIADHEPSEAIKRAVTITLEVTSTAAAQDIQEALRARLDEFYPDDGVPAVPVVQEIQVTYAPLEVIVMRVFEENDPGVAGVLSDEDEWSYDVVACPHPECHSTDFYEVDRSERWNPMELDEDKQPAVQAFQEFDNEGRLQWHEKPNPLVDLPLLLTTSGKDGDGYQTDRYICANCIFDVTLPEWLAAEWAD